MNNANGNYLVDEHKVNKAAVYARLSRLDETKSAREQSESIKNQLHYLNDYSINQGWNVVGEHIEMITLSLIQLYSTINEYKTPENPIFQAFFDACDNR